MLEVIIPFEVISDLSRSLRQAELMSIGCDKDSSFPSVFGLSDVLRILFGVESVDGRKELINKNLFSDLTDSCIDFYLDKLSVYGNGLPDNLLTAFKRLAVYSAVNNYLFFDKALEPFISYDINGLVYCYNF